MKAMRKLLTSLWLVFIPLHSVLFAEGKMPGEPERRSYAERAAELTDIKNPLQASYMKDWIEITRGENIALGKTISASVAANYEHAPNNKLENLLDGRLSKSETGKLLFAGGFRLVLSRAYCQVSPRYLDHG